MGNLFFVRLVFVLVGLIVTAPTHAGVETPDCPRWSLSGHLLVCDNAGSIERIPAQDMFATLQSYQVDYSAYTAKELITKGETVLKGKYTEKYFPVWYNKDVVVPVSLRTEVSGKIVGVLVGTPKVHLNVDQPGTFAVYTIGIGLIVLSGCSRRYTSKANRSPGVRMFGRFLTVSIPCFLLGLGLYLWDVSGIKSSDFFGLLLECILCSGAWLCVHLHMLSRRVRLDAWGRSTRVHQHHNR